MMTKNKIPDVAPPAREDERGMSSKQQGEQVNNREHGLPPERKLPPRVTYQTGQLPETD